MFPIPREAACQRNTLHDFITVISDHEIVLERCRFCREEIRFNVRDGRIDNARYARAHLRDVLQPQGETRELFIHVYGGSAIKNVDKIGALQEKKRHIESGFHIQEMRDQTKDVLKTVQRLDSQAKL